MFKIQNKDYSDYVTQQEMSLVRTYKGEILRTMGGVINNFPESFITVGLSITLLAPRLIADEVRQLLLSANTVRVHFNYNSTQLRGAFSCTNVDCTELRDKNERTKELVATLVSDGTNITDGNGLGFSVKKNGVTLVSNAGFGKVYTLTQSGKINGADIPNNSVLVLGNMEI